MELNLNVVPWICVINENLRADLLRFTNAEHGCRYVPFTYVPQLNNLIINNSKTDILYNALTHFSCSKALSIEQTVITFLAHIAKTHFINKYIAHC